MQPSHSSVTAMVPLFTSQVDALLTAGTDMRIRYWNKAHPASSEVVVYGGNENAGNANIRYK